MSLGIKKSLLATASIGASAAVALTAAPSMAATVNSVTVNSANGGASNCLINASVNFTGTVNDSAGEDTIQIGSETVAGQRFNTPATEEAVVGTTRTATRSLNTTITSAPRTDYQVVVRDPTSTTTAAGAPIIGSAPVPRSMLLAAGGACAAIATNNAPIANAGADQTLNTASASGVVLPVDASASSDADNDALTFTWSQTSGPQATINNANQAMASVAFPTLSGPTVFEFEVRVTDAAQEFSTDRVFFVLTPPNAAPTVNAGQDETVSGGNPVALSGTASDGDNDPLTFQWTQTGGPSVTLSGDTTLTPTFTAPPRGFAAQTLTFELAANDGAATSTDTVTITVAGNAAPIADAGAAQTAAGGSTVTLDASASSDPENDPLIYNWTQISGPSVGLNSPNTVNPTFTAPARTNSAQVLEFQVSVTDSFDATSTATVQITIPSNILPLADAGPDQTATGNSAVTLDGSGSTDPDGDPINYSWTQTGGPSVTLTGVNTVSPTFTAPMATNANQTLTFQLTVNDNTSAGGNTNERVSGPTPQQDTVEITILANSPPVANAGSDQGPIDSGQTVTLDGSASSDPEGDALSYTWTQISGTPVTLTGGTSASPTFTAPLVNGNEDLVFSLIVDDGQLQSVADTVTIGIRAVGSVTIIQQVVGGDTSVSFTSDIAALNSSIATSAGSAQVSAANVSAGAYTVSVGDIRDAGFALTDITCNDGDSVTDLATRSVALELSPGEELVCTFTSTNSRGAAQAAITDFLTGRNALILSHQPDLQRRLDRLDGAQAGGGSATAYGVSIPGSGKLPFALSLADGQASASTSLSQLRSVVSGPDRSVQPFDIWGEALFSDVRLGSQDASFRIFHVGADYLVSDDLLVGVLAEFDSLNDKGALEAGEGEGDGYLIGPYAMARIAPELFAEVRAAWGSSDNLINPLGTYTDAFDTNRALYSGSLVGQFDIGTTTQVRPEFTVRYLDETQQSYTDSLGVAIPDQSVGQGDVSFRPRLQHVVALRSGWTLRPFIETEGIYTFGTNANSVLENGLRARVEGGLDLLSQNGIRASFMAFHDGIGADNFESSGARLAISFGF